MSTLNAPQMTGLSAEAQAKKAIGHVLQAISNHPHIGWYMGIGTQSFSLLTEAYGTLTGTDHVQIKEQFEPENATDPNKLKDALRDILEKAPTNGELEGRESWETVTVHLNVDQILEAREALDA